MVASGACAKTKRSACFPLETIMISPRFPSDAGRLRWSTLVGLAALTIFGAAWGAARSFTVSASPRPAPPQRTEVSLTGPFTHANLAVYVVRGAATDTRDYMTLDEGLTARTVAVREKESGAEVNTLEIENRSDKWLFLQAGDIVKGGKQDRTIMTDLTLAPRSGPQPLEAFCVEHGRWTPSRDGMAFSTNTGIVAGGSLKRAIQSDTPGSQQRVWQEVAKTEDRAALAVRKTGSPLMPAAFSATGTYNAIAEHETLSRSRDEYVSAVLPQIRKDPRAIGLAVAINGVVTSADVYASSALFDRLLPKLLSSYAFEALLARDAAPVAATPTLPQVMAFLSQPAGATVSTQTVGRSIQRATRETNDAVMYEYSRVADPKTQARVVVHQNYVKK
jgi:ARG and Rhodanese-Phosphatase-superfamily-associated Protein domain